MAMAEASDSRSRKRKSASATDGSTKSKKPKQPVPSKLCCVKTCRTFDQQEIDPENDGYVEIKTILPTNALAFVTSSAVDWSLQGDARFHEQCWKSLLKNCNARSKRIALGISDQEKELILEAAETAEYHDSAEDVKREAARIASLIRSSEHCVVFSGAGISTSAGIGDYRGKEGKWTEEDREAALGAQATSEEGVPYENLRPTYTHEALAKLLEMGLVKHIISQNGDGLHGLSGVASDQLSELHGNVFVEVCEKCGHRYDRSFYVLDDNASQYLEDMDELGSSDIPKPKHAVKCPTCGLSHRTGRKCEQRGCRGHLKDSIINFGDDLEEAILRRAEEEASKSDLCLSLGTTMQVTPACDLVKMGQKPLRLAIVNRQKTRFDSLCSKQVKGEKLGSRVFGDCDQVLALVMSHLLKKEELQRWEGGREERLREYDHHRTASQVCTQ